MAHAGQHGCALFDLAFYAFPHLEESKSCLSYLGCTPNPEILRHCVALAETVCCRGQLLNGPYLVSQKQDIAMISRNSDVPTIQIRKIWELDA